MPAVFDNDVVDDSEPEREALRQRERSARKASMLMSKAGKSMIPMVIELTDDESDQAPKPKCKEVVNISGMFC